MNFRLRLAGLLVIASLTVLVPAAFANGPIGVYYLTAGDQAMNWGVQGPSVIYSGAQVGDEYAIALDPTIRTLGNGNVDFLPGAGYTYSLVPTGASYPYPVQGARFYDGTQDARSNYSIDFGAGGVYRFDQNWANPSLLFTLNAFGWLGITYDRTNNSLWVSDFTGNTVADYSMTGSLLSSFTTPFTAITSLAMDVNHTLWMGSQGTLGTFYNYSTAGVQLGTVTYAQLQDENTLGGEIPNTPEPGTLLLIGTGVVGLAARLRKK